MPQHKLKFASADAIPAELKAYANTENEVTVYAGDKVAEETNVGLAANRDNFKREKENFENLYNAIVKTSSGSAIDSAKIIAENEQLKKSTAAPEDLAIAKVVKDTFPGLSATDLAAKVKNYNTIETELTNLKQDKQNSSFFELSGFKNPKIFNKVLADKELNPNLIKTYTQNFQEGTKTVEKLYAEVKQADGTTKTVTFADYVKENPNWNDYIPSLNNGGDGQQNGKTWLSQTSTEGQTHTQSGGGGGAKPVIGAVLDAQDKANQSKVNPLMQTQPTNNASQQNASTSPFVPQT